MTVKFRPERPSEHFETENVVREAFWNVHFPGCNEHFLVHIMRKAHGFVPELNIVALSGNKIVGHIAFMKGVVKRDEGKKHEVLTLGPVAVLPGYQGKGIGAGLIERSKTGARNMGFCGIFLYGDPAYYLRRGFVPAENFGVRTYDNMYHKALHGYELRKGALINISGRYFEDEVYNVDKAAAEKFDKKFPEKEKITGTPSQIRFNEVVTWKKPVEM